MSTVNLFFSRLLLPPTLHDLHDVHDAVWRGFRHTAPVEGQRLFLFRADRVAVDEHVRAWKVLVQATVAADWSGVPAIEATTKEAAVSLGAGESLRFFLRANPVTSVKGRTQNHFAELDPEAFRAERGLKIAVRGEEALEAWLRAQGTSHGFAVDAVRLARHHRESWRARSSGAGHAVHEGADFEGHLRVVDADRLLAAVTTGLGRARGFGFGLLSLARELG